MHNLTIKYYLGDIQSALKSFNNVTPTFTLVIDIKGVYKYYIRSSVLR